MKKVIICCFLLSLIFSRCASNRIYSDEWVMLDTIGIVHLTVWPDVKHRSDKRIPIVNKISIGVAWLVNKQLKDNPYFPRIELDENGVNGEPLLWPIFEGYNLQGLSISLPEKLFNPSTIIQLYEYAVANYNSLASMKSEEMSGDTLLRRAGIR